MVIVPSVNFFEYINLELQIVPQDNMVIPSVILLPSIVFVLLIFLTFKLLILALSALKFWVNELFCKDCNQRFKTKKNLEKHLKSKKHAKNVNKN